MSPINNFEAMRRHNELIYHQAPYTIEIFNNTPIIKTYTIETSYDYNYKQPVVTEDTPNNLGAEIMNFIKVFIFYMLLPSLFSTVFFLWFPVQLFFCKLYSVIIAGFLLLPYFPILSFNPFPYSLWVVFLWFIDFLDLTFYIIFILTCSFLSGVYMFVFDLIFLFF